MKRKSRQSNKYAKDFKINVFVILFLCFLTLIVFLLIQITEQNGTTNCSYADPLIIDVFAFLVAFYLIIEGFVRYYIHRYEHPKTHITRAIRISIGFSMLAIHILQILHK